MFFTPNKPQRLNLVLIPPSHFLLIDKEKTAQSNESEYAGCSQSRTVEQEMGRKELDWKGSPLEAGPLG